jgi:hypothetical protein
MPGGCCQQPWNCTGTGPKNQENSVLVCGCMCVGVCGRDKGKEHLVSGSSHWAKGTEHS